MGGDLLRGEGGDLAVVGPGGEDAGLVHPHHLPHHQAPAAVAHQLLRLDPRPGHGVREILGLRKGLKSLKTTEDLIVAGSDNDDECLISPNIYLNLGPIVCGCLPALGTHWRNGSSYTIPVMIVSF